MHGLHDPVSCYQVDEISGWNYKSASLTEKIQTSRIHYLKKLMTKQCFHPDPVLSEMGFTYIPNSILKL